MPDQRPGGEQAPQNLQGLTEAVKKKKKRVVNNAAMPQKLAALLMHRADLWKKKDEEI